MLLVSGFLRFMAHLTARFADVERSHVNLPIIVLLSRLSCARTSWATVSEER